MGASMGGGGGAGGGSGRRRRRSAMGGAPMAEINVTPFVDVMLVLLIIFMVAAPLLTVGVPLDLPKTNAAPLPREQKPPVSVSVDAEGRIFLGRDELAIGDVVLRVGAEIEDPERERVYVRADAAAQYGVVAQVMAALNSGGFRNIGLVTDRAEAAGAPER